MVESKLKTTSIRFTSRASIKVNDNFFTVEACEERVVPEGIDDIDWEHEKKLLWDSVNDQCDDQTQTIIRMFKDKK